MLRVGTSRFSASVLTPPTESSRLPVTTDTAIGTSCRLCSRFCAVTMISSRPTMAIGRLLRAGRARGGERGEDRDGDRTHGIAGLAGLACVHDF